MKKQKNNVIKKHSTVHHSTVQKGVALTLITSMLTGCVSLPTTQQLENTLQQVKNQVNEVLEIDDKPEIKTYPSLRAMGLQPLLLRFQANVGNERFSCRRSFANVGRSGDFIRFTDLRFYVSEVMAVRKDGTKIPVALLQDSWQSGNVALLDFEDKTGACVQDGTPEKRNFIIGAVPLGDYRGVQFRVGVPSYYRLPGMPLITRPAPVVDSNAKTPAQIGTVQTLARVSDGSKPKIIMQKPSSIRGGEVHESQKQAWGQSAAEALPGAESSHTMTMEKSPQSLLPKTNAKVESAKETQKAKMESMSKVSTQQDKKKTTTTQGKETIATAENSKLKASQSKEVSTPKFKESILPNIKDYFTYPSKSTNQPGIVALGESPQTLAEKIESPNIDADKFVGTLNYPSGQPETRRVGKTATPRMPVLNMPNKPTNPREEAMIRAGLGMDMFRLQDINGLAYQYSDNDMPYVLQAHNTISDTITANMMTGGAVGVASGTLAGGVAAGALYAMGSSTYQWQPMSKQDVSKMSTTGDYPPAPMNIAKLYTRTGVGYAHLRIGMRSTNLSQRELSEELAFSMGQGRCDYGEDSSLTCKRENRPLVELDNFDHRRNVIYMDVLSMMYDMILPAQNKSFEQKCNANSGDYNCDKMFLNFGLNPQTGEPLRSFRENVFSFR